MTVGGSPAPRPSTAKRKVAGRDVARKRNTASHTPRGGVTVHLVLGGSFAREMTGPLRSALVDAGYTVRVEPAGGATPRAFAVDRSGTSIGVLVADDDAPVVAALEQAWCACGVPSLLVVQSHPDVRIGPLDVPGTDLCARCFAARARQNGRSIQAADPQSAGSGRAPTVDGFPPYLVDTVVALVVDRLAVLDTNVDERRNEVTVVNTATLVTRTFPVVPVNQCPGCSDQKPIGLLGGHQPMLADLEGIPR
jgi:bacteriocin biosynthesis cyclodehydratase domain-containing protein